jgi:hypothetical protein
MNGTIFPRRPHGLERHQVIVLDAVEVLAPAVDLFYQRMVSVASYFQAAKAADKPTDFYKVPLISDAVAFIGTVQRLRLVVKKLPGSPEVRVAKKAFEAEVAKYEPARHHFEHLDEQFVRIAGSGHGPFGGLGWLAPREGGGVVATLFAAGTLAPAKGVMGVRMHEHVRYPADHIYATVAGESYYLTGAHDATVKLMERLENWSRAA